MTANTVTTQTESPTPGLKPGNIRWSTRAVQSNALTDRKNRLLREALNGAPEEPLKRLVRLAAVEAEAQAWLTSFPLRLFPTLLEEKMMSSDLVAATLTVSARVTFPWERQGLRCAVPGFASSLELEST